MTAHRAVFLILLTTVGLGAAPRPFAEAAAGASRFGVAVELPDFEQSVADLESRQAAALEEANAAIDALAGQKLEQATFESTFQELDRILRAVSDVAQRANLIRSTHPEAEVRDAAAKVGVELENWSVALEYREDLYHVLSAQAEEAGTLPGEPGRFIDETMRDYRRAGLSLPKPERAEVERLRKELNELTNQFELNIARARAPLFFTVEELAGVPQSFLESPDVRQEDGRYRVMANITWHALAVFENCRVAETRRRVTIARGQLAVEENVPLLARIVSVRAELARRLGYETWADYRTEIQMSGDAATALKFERRLVEGLEPKFQAERETLRQLKTAESDDPDAQLEPWDFTYYLNQLKNTRYSVDTEALRVYFPYEQTLSGMFRIYERIFRLTFTEVEAPYVWAPGVQLFFVTDTATGTPIGMFYLDMFPREGKYNHFACFPIRTGGPLPDGRYELPLVSLVCNFPPPSPERPSLLKHDEVDTLFHEFGHVMHAMLGRARFARFSSFGVPQDFVEAPSQMLENWVWDKDVLDTFAADYRDPTRKVPAGTIQALRDARTATAGTFYRRQLAYGLIDLTLHTLPSSNEPPDVASLSNEVLASVSYPPAPGTVFAAYFGHLSGYDASYYGYLWSLAIATDMASVFEEASGGFLDEQVGRRLRHEIYEAAATRDVQVSIERFLGRPRSLVPFLEFVGVEAPDEEIRAP